jgi:hypothetical protein
MVELYLSPSTCFHGIVLNKAQGQLLGNKNLIWSTTSRQTGRLTVGRKLTSTSYPNHPTHLPTRPPTPMPACVPTCPPTLMPACVPTHPPIYLPTYLPTYVFTYLRSCLLICGLSNLIELGTSLCFTSCIFHLKVRKRLRPWA